MSYPWASASLVVKPTLAICGSVKMTCGRIVKLSDLPAPVRAFAAAIPPAAAAT